MEQTDSIEIQKSDELLRWLHPGQFDWKENRPISAAFTDSYMSVDIEKLTTLEESYERGQKIGKNAVVSFKAELAKERDQTVKHCPTYTDIESGGNVCQTDSNCPAYKNGVHPETIDCTNPAHGCVIGKKTKSTKRYFSRNCQVRIYPPQE